MYYRCKFNNKQWKKLESIAGNVSHCKWSKYRIVQETYCK